MVSKKKCHDTFLGSATFCLVTFCLVTTCLVTFCLGNSLPR